MLSLMWTIDSCFCFFVVILFSGPFLSQKMARFHFSLCENDKSFLVVPGTETESCKTLFTFVLEGVLAVSRCQ